MVAMEPERKTTGNSTDLDGMKPPTSILKPEELMKDRREDDDDGLLGSHSISRGDLSEEPVDDVINGGSEATTGKSNYAAVEKMAELVLEEEVEAKEASSKIYENESAIKYMAQRNIVFRVIHKALTPIFGRTIQRGVPKNTIKGAWLFGALLSLTAGVDPVTSASLATGISYLTITPGAGGDVVRATGEAVWDAGLIGIKVTKKISAAFGYGPRARVEVVDEDFDFGISSAATITSGAVVVDEEINKLVEEVEETVAEVESVLENAQKTMETFTVKQEIEDAEALSEEARLAEIEYLMEEARIEKEANIAEEEFLAEEAIIAEEERLAEVARFEAEERLVELAQWEEEARLAEEEILAEEERLAEEARLAEEEMLAEATRASEENTIPQEEDEEDEDIIQLDDWEASIKLSEQLSPDYADDKNEWNAARQLAEDLIPQVDESADDHENVDFNDPGLTEEERMEMIAKAARAAVEKFEDERKEEVELDLLEKERRNEMKIDLTKNGVNGLSTDQSEPVEVPIFEKMTVVQLKEQLRSRGLKVSGRKAELIERLRSEE